jgi:hypothetical protein
VSTTPVGAMTGTMAGGGLNAPVTTPVAVPLNDTAIPFVGALATGKIESFTATTITNANGGWSGNLADPASPWLLRIMSGPSAGLLVDIVSNTSSTITLTGVDVTTLGLTAGSSSFKLVPVDTLATLFGSTTLMGGTSGDLADNVVVFSGGVFVSYYYDTSLGYWRRSGSSSTANRNNTQLRPESGFLISRRGPTMDLVFTGTVPETQLVVKTLNTGNAVINSGFPTDTTLAAFAANTLVPGWRSAATADSADQVVLFSGGVWTSYFFNGTNWRRSFSSSQVSRDTTPISSTAPLIIFRPSGLSGQFTNLVRPMTYSL